jgi:Zn-dependent M28 family amino/carboxypeptidase
MVLAHYDTVSTSPGADDNASGVAVLLELARALRPFRFQRTVQFVAVNLEESSDESVPGSPIARGSRALAAHAREHGWEIEGVVVLEMVAYAGESIPQRVPPGLPIAEPEAGDFIGVLGNEASAGLVTAFCRAIERHQVALPNISLVVPGRGEMARDLRRSDHISFWDLDYRAIMLTDMAEFRNPHYHRPTDTLETLNIPFAAEVCHALVGMVVDVAGDA